MEPGVPKVLEFGQPRHAVHIKLTGPFWEALLDAQRTGQKVTMNLGGSNVRHLNAWIPFEALLSRVCKVSMS